MPEHNIGNTPEHKIGIAYNNTTELGGCNKQRSKGGGIFPTAAEVLFS
jgi:hypothetical protein